SGLLRTYAVIYLPFAACCFSGVNSSFGILFHVKFTKAYRNALKEVWSDLTGFAKKICCSCCKKTVHTSTTTAVHHSLSLLPTNNANAAAPHNHPHQVAESAI